MIATLNNDLKRLLQNPFPELETMRNIYTETMLNADDLVAAAKRSEASARIGKERIVSAKATTLLSLQEKCEKITEALVVACEAPRIEGAEIGCEDLIDERNIRLEIRWGIRPSALLIPYIGTTSEAGLAIDSIEYPAHRTNCL